MTEFGTVTQVVEKRVSGGESRPIPRGGSPSVSKILRPTCAHKI